ncbi:hypothetical protein [Kitasatospora sp. NBC_00458]|uniref:hypothetical protein n=1 Tax=Kitasatospora sp. NBC_00458 TaxID=2903568 RepID=UPI002E19A2AE
MITSTPVARWYWGEPGHRTDLVGEAVRRFVLALRALDRHRLGTPHLGRVTVCVPEPGHRDFLVRSDFQVGALAVVDSGAPESLTARIGAALTPGEIGTVELFATCDGIVETGRDARAEEGLFTLSVEASEGFFNVGLTTYSDAWLPFDLRGHAQEALFAANGPRLASALAEISEALDLEVDPDDSTWFAVPTETGAENQFEDTDGSPSDVWGRFEVPYRNTVFSQAPTFTPGYGRQASGPVRYVPVVGEQGTLGYLWASDAESAASFEPCDVADLDGYRAGLLWLDRLQASFDRGLAPAEALNRLAASAEDSVAGRAASSETAEVDEFWKLRELARS